MVSSCPALSVSRRMSLLSGRFPFVGELVFPAARFSHRRTPVRGVLAPVSEWAPLGKSSW